MDDQPVRGEVLNAPQRYSKGSSPVSLPPAVVVGDPSEPSAGHPPLVPPSGLVGGFDVRCWINTDVPVPAAVPVLWLRPTTLGAPADGEPLTIWPDSSVSVNDALQPEPASSPLADTTTFPFVAVNPLDFTKEMFVSRPLRLPGGYSIYVVAAVLAGGPALGFVFPAAASISARWLLGVGPNLLLNHQAPAITSVVSPGNYGDLHLFSIRYDGLRVYFRRDGIQAFPQPAQPYNDVPYDLVVPIFAAGGVPGGFRVAEVIVYDQFLGDSADQAQANALRTQYILP